MPDGIIPGLDPRIGPWLIATLLHSVETGIIIGQAITFLSYISACVPGRTQGAREHLVKTVALFVLVTVLQKSSSVWNSWNTLVRNFGDAYEAIQVSWVMKSQQMINVLLAVPVQAFLIWRCWLTMNRNSYMLSACACFPCDVHILFIYFFRSQNIIISHHFREATPRPRAAPC
ncbi:hypothetical protein DFH11DRAFT_193972 [Phellopilus nigrolimitatus]|nr:hypothetical protein DFH11DRAFT_193972 [Phellopilus nigrolimitatus]